MGNFKKLKVWEKAHSLAVRVHDIAKGMRSSRYASLRNQMIRAGESVPTNIVEGSRKASSRDFARFLDYAMNSASELEYHLILARDVGAIPEGGATGLIDDSIEVRKMLFGLIRRIRKAGPPEADTSPPTPV